MADTQVASIVNEILRVESVEEAFSCFLVYKPEQESEKLASYQRRLSGVLATPNTELQESSVRQFLTLTAVLTNRYRTKQLLTLLENLVNSNVLQARLLCDCILANEKLTYDNADFWIECFNLVRRIIGGVDYKGVREIMKGCREKAGTLPVRLSSSSMPQLKALYAVLEYIFDRNASLLPAYFIVTEIHKDYPEKNSWPHWYFAKLFSRLVESFKPCAQMVSIVGHAHMRPVVEMSGLGEQPAGPWRLDPSTLRLPLRGNLPYDEELLRPQAALLRHVLRQPYSRDTLCAMLGLQKTHKQRCVALERQLVELLARPALEGGDSEDERWRWLHLSSQVIYLILIGFASFPNIVTGLRAELAGRDARRGRDRLMWVLLQFISGSIQRNPLANFLPIVGLHELLYPEREPLPVPDCTRATCTHRMAAVCIWMHLLRKAEAEHKAMPMPANLKLQYEFLQHLMTSGGATALTGSDYRIALLCNAYSTNQELYARPMGVIIESLFGGGKPAGAAGAATTSTPGAAGAGAAPTAGTPAGSPSPPPTAPLPMCALDSLTLHCKMSLIHSIVTHVAKLAQNKSSALAPALLETYSRLLVYTEIESLGIKGFINQLLPNVFKAYAWGIFHNLLDMFSYRMHHVQPSYKLTLLSNIHSLAACPQANQTQLQLCFESTALRLIASLERAGVQLLLARAPTDQKPLVSPESEELNRALVLSLARGIHITGAGNDGAAVKELLATIMANTPHMWSQHTLQCFPPVLVEFFAQNPAPKENKQLLKKSVEEEYRKWTSMANDNDIIAHFSVQGTPLFLCLLWKMIFETNRINPIAFKILERIGARALSAHLRKFCDYLVFEVTNPAGGPHINKCVDAINDLVWKYNVVTIDRLVLCLVLRPNPEGNESQVCLYITQLLLLKGSELRNRAQDFVKDNSPDHWRQSNWHEKQLAFHRKYPEKFAADEAGGGAIPVHLSNVCLRFLPVLDLVVHRHLEIPQVSKNLEQLLDHLGYLYKFHDRPVTFLYNTLHYYEARLRDKPALKRRLAAAVLGPRAPLSERFRAYLAGDDAPIAPDPPYCVALLRRLLDCLHGQNPEPGTDWRFSEHGNAAAAALYAACAELLALPVAPAAVARALLRLPHDGLVAAPAADLRRWINALGLVLAALPPAYSAALHDHLHALLAADDMLHWEYDHTPFQLFDFKTTAAGMLENKFSVALALAHAVWYHSGAAQLLQLPQLVGVRLAGAVRSEAQLVFACQLAGGFLQRLHAELPRAAADLAAALYQLLAAVDHAQPHLQYMEPICDLFYHIKYMFVGDTLKSEVEAVVRTLRPALQMRLRFIAHLNVDHIGPA